MNKSAIFKQAHELAKQIMQIGDSYGATFALCLKFVYASLVVSTEPNTYVKYAPNVFLAKCAKQYKKGDITTLTTKYGKENEVEIVNLVVSGKDGYFYYSFIRTDGFNSQVRAQNKANRLNGFASTAHAKSTQYFEASNEGKDFLSLAEPIKIGHHSEKRHRALIERNWNRMGKSVEFTKKAENYEERAKYWESQKNKIDLSMPESLQYFEFKLEQAKQTHKFYKDNPDKREHSYSLTYANKAVKEMQKNHDLAVKLWG